MARSHSIARMKNRPACANLSYSQRLVDGKDRPGIESKRTMNAVQPRARESGFEGKDIAQSGVGKYVRDQRQDVGCDHRLGCMRSRIGVGDDSP